MAKQEGSAQKHSERVWSIPCGFLTDEGLWVEQPERMGMALQELQNVLTRVGGICHVGPIREELQPVSGSDHALPVQFCTTALVFRWQSFAPAVKAAAPPPEPEAASS